MKWLFVLLLALAIFGGAAWFGYNTFVKEEIEVQKEQRGEVTPPPAVDVSLPAIKGATPNESEIKRSVKGIDDRDQLTVATGDPRDIELETPHPQSEMVAERSSLGIYP